MQCWMVLGKPFMCLAWFYTHVSHIRRSEPPGVGCRTPGFEMQIGKQWQRLNKHSVNKCAWSQQAKLHMLTASVKPACEWLATTVAFLLSLLKSRLLFFYILFHTCHIYTQEQPVRCSLARPCLLSLTASSLALNIPTDVPAMWDPTASLDPSAMLPAEVAVQQVQIMASIALALLAQPFSE